MKILILSQYWYPENGVPQRRWSWLSSLLVDNGHEVTVVCPPAHNERKVSFVYWLRSIFRPNRIIQIGPSGESILRSGYFPAGQSLTSRAINQGVVAIGMLMTGVREFLFSSKQTPDLVIGTVPAIPTALITPVLAWALRRPYIIDLRDAWPDLLDESKHWNTSVGRRSWRQQILILGPMQVVRAIVRKSMNYSLKCADGILVTSEYFAKMLEERFADSSLPVQIATVRNVFPPELTVNRAPSSKRNLDSLNVLYAGTLGRAQKLSNVLDAVKIASNKGLKIRLKFVGAGAARAELQRRIDAEKLPVEILGRVPAAELLEFYNWADTALVHLTNWPALQQTVPSKTFELMEIGLHITGVVDGEAADLIKKLNAGHVVPPEDPERLAQLWSQLLADPSMLQVGNEPQNWVRDQREVVMPGEFLQVIDRLSQ